MSAKSKALKSRIGKKSIFANKHYEMDGKEKIFHKGLKKAVESEAKKRGIRIEEGDASPTHASIQGYNHRYGDYQSLTTKFKSIGKGKYKYEHYDE